MAGYEIRTIPSKGRALFATKNYSEGDTILEEVPLVSSQFSWNRAYKYLACEFCMKPLETAEENFCRLSGQQQQQQGTAGSNLPHPECCKIKSVQHLQTKCPNCPNRYCSVECLNTALERYHRVLCLGQDHENAAHPINALNEAWKKMHYPPETTTILLIVKLLAMYKQTERKNELLEVIQDFHHELINEELRISHKMLGEDFQSKLNQLYELYSKSFDFTGMDVFLNRDIFNKLFALIGRNGQGIGTSSFADWVRSASSLNLSDEEKANLDAFIDDCYSKLEEVTGLQFLNNEGSALYSLESKANHSCIPNAHTVFPYSNHVLQLVALKDIQAGEEICISYLDECVLARSRHSRHKELRDHYLFNCTCPKCEEQRMDPDVTSDEEDDDDEEEMDED